MESRQPLATWNRATGVWETEARSLCGHSVLFSQTWPTSGMTLRGVAYELPTWVPPTAGSGCSSSPGLLLATPRAQHGEPRNQNVWERPLDQPQNLENQLARLPSP